jgi:predicted nucleotidyltransferase
MFQEIQNKLTEIEQTHGIRIVYACESGSRAWGFPSTDSDYDVRFIYVKPLNDYLSINDYKDTFGLPVNEVLDINGWEIRKSLRLFKNSNAPLYEWLQSPIVYAKNDAFLMDMQAWMHACFSLKKGMHHYLSMTKTTWAEIQSDEIKIKNYFYCLRSLLAACWIADKQQLPPMDLSSLRTSITNDACQQALNALLKIKLCADEKTMIKPDHVLHDFIENRLIYCENSIPEDKANDFGTERLDRLFRAQLHDF